MCCADSDPSLSARRRAALRFDLEDRQIELIDELHALADSLFGPLRAAGPAGKLPAGWPRLPVDEGTGEPLAELLRLDRAVTALFRVNRALARIDAPGYGRCSECGAAMSFQTLASDPTRCCCPACGRQ